MKMFFLLLFIFTICVEFNSCIKSHHKKESYSIDIDLDIGFKKRYLDDNPDKFHTIQSNDLDNYRPKPELNPRKEFVDHFDMFHYDRTSKTMVYPENTKNIMDNKNLVNCQKWSTYMQRFLNLFLRYAELKDTVMNDSSMEVRLDLIVNKSDLETIQMFAETGSVDMSAVDGALTNIFNYSEKKTFGFISPNNVLMFILRMPHDYPKQSIIVCALCIFLIALYQLNNSNSWRNVFVSLVFIIFIGGCGWNWFRLHKLAQAKNLSKKILMKHSEGEIPIYCRPDDMTWFEYYIKYSDFNKKCAEYYELTLVDPYIEVSPTDVLAETLTKFFLYPVGSLAESIAIFITILYDVLPWYVGMIFIPLIIVMIFAILVVVIVLTCHGEIELSSLLLKFKIGSKRNIGEQRQMIDEIPNESTSPSIKITSNEIDASVKEKHLLFKRLKLIKASIDGSGDAKNNPYENDFSNKDDVAESCKRQRPALKEKSDEEYRSEFHIKKTPSSKGKSKGDYYNENFSGLCCERTPFSKEKLKDNYSNDDDFSGSCCKRTQSSKRKSKYSYSNKEDCSVSCCERTPSSKGKSKDSYYNEEYHSALCSETTPSSKGKSKDNYNKDFSGLCCERTPTSKEKSKYDYYNEEDFSESCCERTRSSKAKLKYGHYNKEDCSGSCCKRTPSLKRNLKNDYYNEDFPGLCCERTPSSKQKSKDEEYHSALCNERAPSSKGNLKDDYYNEDDLSGSCCERTQSSKGKSKDDFYNEDDFSVIRCERTPSLKEISDNKDCDCASKSHEKLSAQSSECSAINSDSDYEESVCAHIST